MLQFNTRHRCARLLLSGASLFALGAVAVPAHAQMTDDTVQSDETMTRDVVVVTATRREESLLDVPMSLNAFSGDRLEQSGVDDVEGLQFLTPGLAINNERGQAKLTLRGIGSNQISLGAESGVAVHRDGTYLANRFDVGMGLFDVQRVEVLRGPQGTLYGRNATGGSINIISNSPTSSFASGGSITVGSYDLISADGYLSGPITGDSVNGRIAFRTSKRDGYTKNIFNSTSLDNEDLSAVRATIRIEPSDRFNLDLAADFAQDDGVAAFVYGRGQAGMPLAGELLGSVIPEGRAVNNNNDQIQDKESWGMSAKANWNLDGVTLSSLTSYRQFSLMEAFDADGSNQSLLYILQDHSDKSQLTQEITATSTGDGPFSWIVGAFYFDGTEEQYSITPIPPIDLVAITDIPDLSTEAYAIFSEGTYDVTDRLSVTLGARYSSEKKSITVGAAAPLTDEWESFTPKGAVTYRFTDELSAYATVSQGFKAGGYNGTQNAQGAYGPEEVTNYEIGFKAASRDGRHRANISVFSMDYSDLQVQVLRTNPDTGVVQGVIDNAATATINGVEFDFQAQPSDQFWVDGNLSYLDATFENWPDAIDGFSGGAVVDVSGNRLPNAPEWSGNIGLNYLSPLGVWGDVTFRGEYAYTSELFFTPYERVFEGEDSFGFLNARVEFAEAGGRWKIAGWVKNLTDEEVISNTFQSGNGITGRPTVTAYHPPRTFGVTVGYDF